MMAVAVADSIVEAHRQVYGQLPQIHCPNLFYRNDIAHQALDKTQQPVILDGKLMSQQIKEELHRQVEQLTNAGNRAPALAVILVGENPASKTYVNGKIKACAATGIQSHLVALPESATEQELLQHIETLNQDSTIDGILVQLPLPKHINPDNVINAIAPEKDVDAFHPVNVAELWNGKPGLVPCTPQGIMYMLKSENIQLDGKVAVVVGRSNIVGKPIAKLLLDQNATVIMAHSHTKDLESITRMADILVVAVGKKHCIGPQHVKQGAVVIDVGINRDTDGKLYGDVDYEKVKPLASYITPVPGGVGPMTIAMLLENTLQCYKQRNNIK